MKLGNFLSVVKDGMNEHNKDITVAPHLNDIDITTP